MSGKGSKRRPYDQKKYDENYDKINWKKIRTIKDNKCNNCKNLECNCKNK
jgi:hypothetical protein